MAADDCVCGVETGFAAVLLGSARAALCLLAIGLVSCGGELKEDSAGSRGRFPADEVGTITIELTVAPSDARCLRITAVGSRLVTRLFDLTPGQSTTLTFPGVPAGPVSVLQEAYGVICEQVDESTPASWMSERAVFALVQANQSTAVESVLRPTGTLRISADFDRSAIAMTPPNADFGGVTLGASQSVTFTIANVGQVATGGITSTIVGPHAGDFTVTSAPCGSTAPGQRCQITLTFRPRAASKREAALGVSATPGGVATAALVGVGLSPAALIASPAEHNFGLMPRGASAGPVIVTVTNVGETAAAEIMTETTATSPGGLAFRVQNDECIGRTLAAGARCTMAIRATAGALVTGSPQSATVRVAASDGTATEITLRLTVQ